MKTTKLDEEVAQHIMNWKKSGKDWIDEDGNHVVLKPFSTDLNATWEVVDKICDLGFRLQLSGSRIWQARFYKSASLAHARNSRVRHDEEHSCRSNLHRRSFNQSAPVSLKRTRAGAGPRSPRRSDIDRRKVQKRRTVANEQGFPDSFFCPGVSDGKLQGHVPHICLQGRDG